MYNHPKGFFSGLNECKKSCDVNFIPRLHCISTDDIVIENARLHTSGLLYVSMTKQLSGMAQKSVY